MNNTMNQIDISRKIREGGNINVLITTEFINTLVNKNKKVNKELIGLDSFVHFLGGQLLVENLNDISPTILEFIGCSRTMKQKSDSDIIDFTVYDKSSRDIIYSAYKLIKAYNTRSVSKLDHMGIKDLVPYLCDKEGAKKILITYRDVFYIIEPNISNFDGLLQFFKDDGFVTYFSECLELSYMLPYHKIKNYNTDWEVLDSNAILSMCNVPIEVREIMRRELYVTQLVFKDNRKLIRQCKDEFMANRRKTWFNMSGRAPYKPVTINDAMMSYKQTGRTDQYMGEAHSKVVIDMDVYRKMQSIE